MKKYIFLILTGLTINAAHSQDISDAMRYSQDNLNGTARFRAMGGAFGALGGDLSSLNVNPAGSAVFANNQFGVTLSNYNTKNNSNYFGTKTKEKENSFILNQAGGVMVFKDSYSSSNWKKLSVGVNYENTNNYNNDIFSSGVNPTNSIDKYFLSYANTSNGGAPVPQEYVNTQSGESISRLYRYLGSNFPNSQYPGLSGYAAQQAMIGYQGFIINPTDINNPNSPYYSLVPAGGNYYQENEVHTNGYNGKLSFNAATSYKDKLFIGINLNSHFADYTRNTSFYEDNTNNNSAVDQINRLRFDNQLYTYGNGFSFQVGAIAKVTDQVRLGLAYESNTWYKLYDETTQKLVSVTSNNTGELPPTIVDPQIINVYESYKLQTPGKWTASFAYIFGKTGLLSVDYAIKDYGNTKFKPTNEFRGANTTMSDQLTNSSEVRVGAEYKIKLLSLRAGYRYEQSPYKNSSTMGDLNGYSGGLGYNFGATKVDLAYSYAKRNSQQAFFNQGFTDGANINTKFSNVSLTMLFEL
ncbi:outer membrane protein transport protein [Flavobacterium sp. F-65]|uniref:Outer membrane protein transport protein n=1 Tax=Flavobacterium pisciphilum TaxID=2893755 RepID=A0ABS8MRI7_9FLAO|nr:outer membrane protein transport protein [Flavobacterium sp. F-65]MCC9071378.1 outer membrane protein transport protein [Flavobacterium sp. F-65]